MMRIYGSLLIMICCANQILAQCQAILPFTEKSLEEIHDVYQFTFLHQKPQNKLDSLVLQIMHPAMVIDSNYFDWNMNTSKVRSVVDRLQMYKIIDEIGSMKNNEAFLLLNLYYLLPFKVQDDLNPFVTFCANIAYFGGPMAINTYFLHHEVSEKLAFPEFQNEVILKSIALRNQYLKGIEYCKLLEGNERILYEMQQINPEPYDRMIEKTINKYLNRNSFLKDFYSRDSIMIDILQLPFTHDAIWDDCVQKEDDENGKNHFSLGVVINAGKDMYDQNLYIIRVYEIENHIKTGQKIINTSFSPDFVSRIRRLCDGIQK